MSLRLNAAIANYRDVILEGRLRQALVRLNPQLPTEALEDAYRKTTRADAPSLVERILRKIMGVPVAIEFNRDRVHWL